MDTRAFKRSLNSSDNYHRKGFGHEADVSDQMQSEYQSDLVQQIRSNNFTIQRGDVTIRLAEALVLLGCRAGSRHGLRNAAAFSD
jgi:4-hydroxy-3-methylbut-2-enyl diphosphate reductase